MIFWLPYIYFVCGKIYNINLLQLLQISYFPIGKAAEEVIKDNGNEIIQEVGEPIIEYIIGKVVDSMRQFYTAVPVEELVQN